MLLASNELMLYLGLLCDDQSSLDNLNKCIVDITFKPRIVIIIW